MHPTDLAVPPQRHPAPQPQPTHPIAPHIPAAPPQLRTTDPESAPNPARKRARSDDSLAAHSDHTTELASNPAFKVRRFDTDETANHSLADLIRDGNLEAVAARLRASPRLLNQPDPLSSTTPLCLAAGTGRADMVELMIKAGAQINAFSKNDRTALMVAASAGHADIVRLLCDNGAKVNLATINDNKTALHLAAEQGQADVVQRLLEAKANPNLQDDTNTMPLIAACTAGHTAIAALLLAKGAAIDVADADGKTALHFACEKGTPDLVTLLLERGAAVNTAGHWGDTPLMAASRAGNTAIAALLLAKGVAINTANKDGRTALYIACQTGAAELVTLLLERGAAVNAAGRWGDTSLMAACRAGHTATVSRLLATDVALDSANEWHETPLMLACESGALDLVALLITQGAAVNQMTDQHTAPLESACKTGNTAIASLLLEAGAALDFANKSHKTALMLACESGALDLVTLLLERGAPLNAVDEWEDSALMLACKNSHSAIAIALIKKGAEINSSNGFSALCRASFRGLRDTVELLLAHGATVDPPYEENIPPLIAACMNGHTAIVRLLLDAGANIEFINPEHNTALYQACENGYPEVVDLLLARGAVAGYQDDSDIDPLAAALQQGHFAVAKLLLAAGAVINTSDDSDLITALSRPCSNGTLDFITFLLEKAVSVNLLGHRDTRALITSALLEACEGGHLAVVKMLLDAGADINAADPPGDTPFALACREGRTELIEFMLQMPKQRTTINRPNREGRTPLMQACRRGHGGVAQMLIAAGADIHAVDQAGNTLPGLVWDSLRWQGTKLHELIDILIAAGADPNKPDQDGTIVLHEAVIANDLKTVRKLVNAGADLTQQVGAGAQRGLNALDLALQNRHYRLVEYLLANNAAPGFIPGNPPLARVPLTDALSVDLVNHVALLADSDLVSSHGLANTLLIDDPVHFYDALHQQMRMPQTATPKWTPKWSQWLLAQGVSAVIVEDFEQRLVHLAALSEAVTGPGQKHPGAQQASLIAHLLGTLTETNNPGPYADKGLSYTTQHALNNMVQQQRTLLAKAGVFKEKAITNLSATTLVDEALKHYNLSGGWNHAAFYKSLTKQGGLYTQNATRLVTLFRQALQQARQHVINTPLLGFDMVQGQAKLHAQFKAQLAARFKELLQKNATTDKAPPGFRVGFESFQNENAARYFSLAVFDQWATIVAAQGVTLPETRSLQPAYQ